LQNDKLGQSGLQKYEPPTKDFCLIENWEEYFSEIKSSSNLKKFCQFEDKRIISIFLATSTIFACGKNGERSRKASLHAASVALHSKPKVFFTSSRIPGSLACEVVSLRCRFIALVKPLRNSGLCLALLDFQSALLWLKPLSLRL